jgi:hypothetical protein
MSEAEIATLTKSRSAPYMLTNMENIAIAVGLFVIDFYFFRPPPAYTLIMPLATQRLWGFFMQCLEAKNRADVALMIGLQNSLLDEAHNERRRAHQKLMNMYTDEIALLEFQIRKSEDRIRQIEAYLADSGRQLREWRESLNSIDCRQVTVLDHERKHD